MKNLSQAQAETVDEVLNCVDPAFSTFDAYYVFPLRNNTDNGHRRTLNTLVKRGLLNREGTTTRYIIPNWQALLDAAREYHSEREWGKW